jgi:hypothetical protein
VHDSEQTASASSSIRKSQELFSKIFLPQPSFWAFQKKLWNPKRLSFAGRIKTHFVPETGRSGALKLP